MFFRRKYPVTAEKVRFSYSNTQQVLKNINLNVKPGAITAIIGKSGSGKSTFLKLVAGVITNTYTGKIRIFGRSKSLAKGKIGFVPQENAFVPDLSIKDNVKIVGLNYGVLERISMRRAQKLMSMLKLEESMDKMPYDLSGGERVRLNIILSLLHNPRTVILDEPFVGLDFRNRRILWHFLNSLKNRGRSVILTSHLLSEAQKHANRIIIIKNGRTKFAGTPASLAKKLEINHILEIHCRLSAKDRHDFERHVKKISCSILDEVSGNYLLGLRTSRSRSSILNYLEKRGFTYTESSYREPSLDEVFLNV